MIGARLARSLGLLALLAAMGSGSTGLATPDAAYAEASVTTTPCAALTAASGRGDHGLRLTGYRQLDERLAELTFTTALVPAPTRVRVLTPSGFDCATARRYPVIWALHGSNGSAATFTTDIDTERITDGVPVIVVMPETSATCGYFDAYNEGRFGAPAWETYHLQQLLPWIDDHFPTIADRSGRAVVGHSMGGGGAVLYAARRPDLFRAAVGFSGAVDFADAPIVAVNAPQPYCRAAGGDFAANEVYIRGRNPIDLADNLSPVDVESLYGNGAPGPLDGPVPDPVLTAVELEVYNANRTLDARLDSLGIAHRDGSYGAGTHSFAYASRDFVQALPRLMQLFGVPAPVVRQVTYRSIDPIYQVFGWRVSMTRPVREFSELRDADRHGLTVTGSGSAAIRTPPRYRPGTRVRIRVHTETGTTQTIRRAGKRGRVTARVVLGPSNTVDEFTPASKLGGTVVHHATVRLETFRQAARQK